MSQSTDQEEVGADGTARPAASAVGDRPLRRLDDILRALPPGELKNLIDRLGIRIDAQKRIDVPSQVARALAGMPDVRDPSRLAPPAQDLIHRIAEASGILRVRALPPGIEQLVRRGIVFARRLDSSNEIEIVLPYAYLVQLPTWGSENPRSLRALVAQAPFETVSAIASHFLGRPATPPIALALESAWELLMDHDLLHAEVARLPLLERRLLESIEAMGGEVETTELLDLEREPMRLRTAKGVNTTRRGASFALERRGMLIPVHPNRHIVPAEIAAIVGFERKRQLESRRAAIRKQVTDEDHMPRRAQFSRDPAPLALALAIAVRESAGEVRPNVGTPRSLLVRLAQRFGRSSSAVGLIAAISRAIGLWEPNASLAAAPPGSLHVHELSGLLFQAWLNGGAWDEARLESELLRASPDTRDPSPCRVLREIILESLGDLGVGGWVPYAAFEDFVLRDPRIEGIERLLRRWSERIGLPEPPATADLVRRIALESLPVLGVLDLGSESDARQPAQSAIPSLPTPPTQQTPPPTAVTRFPAPQPGPTVTMRVTARGRNILKQRSTEDAMANASRAQTEPPKQGSDRAGPIVSDKALERSHFLDTQVLRVGVSAVVGNVIALGVLAEVGRVEDQIDLVLTPATIAKVISAGALADEIRERIELLAPLPDGLSQILMRAAVVVGQASLVATSGFLWVDDPDVRELLRTRRPTSDLFLDPSPPGGLLVAAHVDIERLVRRCRSVGVEVEVDAALRARAALAQSESASGARRVPRSTTPMGRRHSSTTTPTIPRASSSSHGASEPPENAAGAFPGRPRDRPSR
ncbi:MAG: hypothetical protein U0271_44085 [Polyangiaceae bacterium]